MTIEIKQRRNNLHKGSDHFEVETQRSKRNGCSVYRVVIRMNKRARYVSKWFVVLRDADTVYERAVDLIENTPTETLIKVLRFITPNEPSLR